MRIVLLLTLVVFSCAGRPSGVPIRVPPPPEAGRGVLGSDDVIEVRVYLEDSLSGTYRVDADGNILFPLLGTVAVSGRSTTDVAESIRAGLADGFLKEPHVTVVLNAANSRKISVLGEVKNPGRYPFHDGMTLVEAIAEAGGTTPSAVLSGVTVTRREAAGESSFDVPFREITQGRRPDFRLLPGDVIFVLESAVK
jgi:polysaccharide export outer membrane protein